MPDFSLEDLHIPASVDAADGGDFRAVAAYAREIRREFLLSDDRDHPDEAYRVEWTSSPSTEQLYVVAKVDGEIVGWFGLSFPLLDNLHLVWAAVRVPARFRGNGYGRALTAAMHERAARPGRSTIIGSTFHTAADLEGAGERVAPASGNGFVPADAPGVRLAISEGYSLAQVARTSVADPRELDLEGMRRDAAEKAGDGYHLVQWHGPTPRSRRDDMAHLYNRMSTDIPLGALDMQEEAWTAESLTTMEKRVVAEGREQWVTAVDFAGTLVAFTILYSDDATPRVADQEETLVVTEHRGRSLGLLIKAANAQYLLAHKPRVEHFHTWNATENDRMLAINAAMGFHGAGGSGSWQKALGA